MKRISVDATPKQISRLRNGHSVRLKKGTGLILLVHPGRFDVMSKTFQRGKARTVALSPEELLANMKVSPESHQEVQGTLDGLQDVQGMTIDSKAQLAKPKGAVIGQGLVNEPPSRTPVTNSGGSRGYMIKTLGGARDLTKQLARLGDDVGMTFGAQLRAGLGSLEQNWMSDKMSELEFTSGRENQIIMNHLDTNNIVGTGLYAGKSVMFGRGGRREVSSVGVGGTLLSNHRSLPPALQSQPLGAHFAQNAQLPPAYRNM